MSQIKTQLQELAHYYDSVRGVGNTTAVVNAAKVTPGCLVVAATQNDGERLEGLIGIETDAMVIGLPGIRMGRLAGLKKPMLFDNHAMEMLVKQSLFEINRLESKLVEIRALANSHAHAVKQAIES